MLRDNLVPFEKIVHDVRLERDRQNLKWGVQSHKAPIWSLILGEEYGEACQAILHNKFGGDHAKTLRQELVQVAAVAIQWIEHIDRKGSEN